MILKGFSYTMTLFLDYFMKDKGLLPGGSLFDILEIPMVFPLIVAVCRSLVQLPF